MPLDSKPEAPAAPAPKPSAPTSSELTGKLKWYYARLFPVDSFAKWLRYGSDKTLSRREISFTLPGDIYVRYKSFSAASQLHDALKAQSPVKIDVGAVYNAPPRSKHVVSAPLTPLSKELVFDVDMTDYSDVLGSCRHADPVAETDAAWPLMAAAVRVLDDALRTDFGFKQILFVYSGRRGFHCWVCDARARALPNEARAAIVDFLSVRFDSVEAVSNLATRRNVDLSTPLHPSLRRAVDNRCRSVFHSFTLGKAGVRVADLTALVPGARPRAELRGVDTWERFEKEVTRMSRNEWSLRGLCDYIILRHTYPRLDANVSREINHLLKAPFSVHPKTQRVCVPFEARDVEAFDPALDAPLLADLVRELGQNEPDSKEGSAKTEGAEETKPHTRRLQRSVEVFERFIRGVEEETAGIQRRERLNNVEAKAALELVAH